jgi:hypothetical protein
MDYADMRLDFLARRNRDDWLGWIAVRDGVTAALNLIFGWL